MWSDMLARSQPMQVSAAPVQTMLGESAGGSRADSASHALSELAGGSGVLDGARQRDAGGQQRADAGVAVDPSASFASWAASGFPSSLQSQTQAESRPLVAVDREVAAGSFRAS